MQLKDAKGRTVLVKVHFGEGVHVSFHARDGFVLEQVQEAVVADGDEVFLDVAFVENALKETGVKAASLCKPTVSECKYSPVSVGISWDSPPSYYGAVMPRRTYTVNGCSVSEDEIKKVTDVVKVLNEYNGIRYWSAKFGTGFTLAFVHVIEMIGIGGVVTPASLLRACAKGEDRPRLMPGDTVEVVAKAGKVFAAVKSMAGKVVVLRKDGTKGSHSYDKVVRVEGQAYDDAVVGGLDATLKDNFESLKGQAHRIYRAKLERATLAFPMFPDETAYERQRTFEDVAACHCPLCGWMMANFRDDGEFQCSYCRVRGIVLRQTEDEVGLLMLRNPAKNRFAIKECRCCSNCGLFYFESGRQGKRSTGYCRASNQCVQAFNTCDVWVPRDPKKYESNMRQHVTNLGYGVNDKRNTSRNDLRDTIYRKDDHESEKARADKARVVYEQAYLKWAAEMRGLVDAAPLAAGQDEAVTKRWLEVLDDPC